MAHQNTFSANLTGDTYDSDSFTPEGCMLAVGRRSGPCLNSQALHFLQTRVARLLKTQAWTAPVFKRALHFSSVTSQCNTVFLKRNPHLSMFPH